MKKRPGVKNVCINGVIDSKRHRFTVYVRRKRRDGKTRKVGYLAGVEWEALLDQLVSSLDRKKQTPRQGSAAAVCFFTSDTRTTTAGRAVWGGLTSRFLAPLDLKATCLAHYTKHCYYTASFHSLVLPPGFSLLLLRLCFFLLSSSSSSSSSPFRPLRGRRGYDTTQCMQNQPPIYHLSLLCLSDPPLRKGASAASCRTPKARGLLRVFFSG